MKITDMKVKGGNFLASISGELAADKLQGVVESGISYEAERGGLSKVFKGIEDRKTLAFSADSSKIVADKLTSALADFFAKEGEGKLSVVVSAREWSKGAGEKQASAQAAYDEMLSLGMSAENAMKVAIKVLPSFKLAAASPVATAPAPAQAEEAPMKVG